MPFVVALRSTEIVSIQTEEADSLHELYGTLASQIPDGFELEGIRPSQNRGQARRAGVREVTIETRDELDTCAPDGWEAISIRAT
ncbi:MAG: hypothetical protein ACTHX2_10925 [Microbacterium sp.]